MKQMLQGAAIAMAAMFFAGLMLLPSLFEAINAGKEFDNLKYTQKLQVTIDSKTVDLYVTSSHKLNCKRLEGLNNGIKCY